MTFKKLCGEFGGEKGGAPADYEPAFNKVPHTFSLTFIQYFT